MTTTRSRTLCRGDLAGHYGRLLEAQARSGLSVSEFAEDVGVSAATLYSWRRRLAGRAAKVEAGELLEVQITGDEAGLERVSSIVLTVDGRLRVELGADFDDETLERLLRVLSRC